MNLDDLTLGQAKQLAAMFGGTTTPKKELIGEYVIVRCRDAGVHAGTLVDYEGRNVTLKDSRRLWYWVCAKNQHSLSGVAAVVIDPQKSKIPAVVGTLVLSDACELIQASQECQRSITAVDVHEVD